MTAIKKQIYVVLGMARSGTSAITRGLGALGVPLGNHLIPGNDKWNAKGFFEDKDIVYKVNRRALDLLNKPIIDVIFEDTTTRKRALSSLKETAISLLHARMDSLDQWCFKDPRTAILLPFWQDIFAENKMEVNYLITLRNPLATALSYQRVTGADIEIGLLLWLTHLLAAINDTSQQKRLIVSYDDLLVNPAKELSRMQHYFSLLSPSKQEIETYTTQFLDNKLQHFTTNETHEACSAIPLCMDMYHLLLSLAHDEINFDERCFNEQWSTILNEFKKSQSLYRYLFTLENRLKAQERELRTIRKSLPFKLTFPLRIIDDALRHKRKLLRVK